MKMVGTGVTSNTACSAAGVQIAVTFVSDFGDLPLVTLTNSGLATLSVTQTTQGTKQTAVCSARGICNTDSGTCSCFKGYMSSDGSANAGQRNDCGSPSGLASWA